MGKNRYSNDIRMNRRDLIFESSRPNPDLLSVRPLVCNVQVIFQSEGAPVVPETKKTFSKELDKVMEDFEKKVNAEVKEMVKKYMELVKADGTGDASARKKAKDLVDKTISTLEDIADDVPVALRRKVDALINVEVRKNNEYLYKQASEAVATTGFHSSKNAIVIPRSAFKASPAADEDDEGDADLAKALVAVKAVDAKHAWYFVVACGRPSGLVLSKKPTTAAHIKVAKEKREGLGDLFVGRCHGETGKYIFTLLEDTRPPSGLAKKLKDAVQKQAEVNIRLAVRGANTELDSDTDKDT